MIILQWKISLEYSYIFFKLFTLFFCLYLFIMDKVLVHCSQVVNPFMDKFEDKITCYRILNGNKYVQLWGLIIVNTAKNIFYISHNSKWTSLASKLLTTNYIVYNLHIHEGNIYVLNHCKLIEELELVISKYMVPN